jgi:omega-amidase
MLRVAVLQLRLQGLDKASNVRHACEMIKNAAGKGCKVAVLPEFFNSPYGLDHFKIYAECIPGPTSIEMGRVAKEYGMWIIAGTIPESSIENSKLYNTCTVFDPSGSLVAKYRKMHLFDVSIPGQIEFKESLVLSRGESPSTVEIGEFKVGLGICFDLRFPELALHYSRSSCSILVYPSAFSKATGPKYWELLQRARAVDTQSFVMTCSPAASGLGDFEAYGRSMIVNPDGSILASVDGDHEQMLIVDLDMKSVEAERLRIPILAQKGSI